MPNPSGRATRIRYGNMLLPAVCSMCGRGGKTSDGLRIDNDEIFADLGVDFQWEEAHLYLCVNCATEIGQLFGLGPVGEVQQELNRSRVKVVELQSSVATLENRFDTFTYNRLVDRHSPATLIGILSSEVASDANKAEPTVVVGNSSEDISRVGAKSRESDEAVQPSVDSQPKSKKSANVERSDDTSESTSTHDLIDSADAILSGIGISESD